ARESGKAGQYRGPSPGATFSETCAFPLSPTPYDDKRAFGDTILFRAASGMPSAKSGPGANRSCRQLAKLPLSHNHDRAAQKKQIGVITLDLPLQGECVVESVPSNDAGVQKRRSTRIVQAVPINVSGVDALGQPFKERTTTVMVNCHGCKYQSKHYVPKNSTVTLEIPRTEPALPARTVKGRVVWVQRPKVVRELFQIGLEFETAGNVWGIAFPPDDWFPCAEYDTGEIFGASPASGTAKPVASATTIPITPEKAETSARISGPAAVSPAAPEAAPDNKIHVVPAPAQTTETHLASAQQMAKMVAEAKDTLEKTLRRDAQSVINEEMTFVRQQLDTQLHEAVEHAIKISMERVSESAGKKFMQQASERSAAIVEEARRASH